MKKYKWKKYVMSFGILSIAAGCTSATIINTNKIYDKKSINEIEEKLFINSPVSVNDQKEMFKNLSVSDVLNEVLDESSDFNVKWKSSIILDNNQQNLDYIQEINENKEIFEKITSNVLSGEITSQDILSNLDNYKKNNRDDYEKIITNIYNGLEKDTILINDSSLFQVSRFSSNSTEYKNMKIRDKNGEIITVSADNIFLLSKIDEYLKIMDKYRDKMYGVSIASATLTAASWAVAAFYWAAIWMFGGNVPFAIAATTSATISTIMSVETFNEYYDAKNQSSALHSFRNSSEFNDYYTFIKRLKELTPDNVKGNLILDIGTMLTKFAYDNFSSKIITFGLKNFNNFLSNFTNTFLKKMINHNSKIFLAKTFFQQVNMRVRKVVTNLISKRIALKALSWAVPVSTVISILDVILEICSTTSDIALFVDKYVML